MPQKELTPTPEAAAVVPVRWAVINLIASPAHFLLYSQRV